MLSIQELDNYLKSSGADYEILEHDKPILTTQDAKQYFDTDRAAPVLVVQTERGLMILIVSARRGRLDFKELAAKLGFYTESDLTRAEGFGNIIVSPGGETKNFIDIIISGGKKQDGAIRKLPDPAADLQTVHIRKHDI